VGTRTNALPLFPSQGLPASITDSATIAAPVQYAAQFSTAAHGAYVPGGLMHVMLCVVTLLVSLSAIKQGLIRAGPCTGRHEMMGLLQLSSTFMTIGQIIILEFTVFFCIT
jgi:hypothetical protein